jgi:hypothetical protein
MDLFPADFLPLRHVLHAWALDALYARTLRALYARPLRARHARTLNTPYAYALYAGLVAALCCAACSRGGPPSQDPVAKVEIPQGAASPAVPGNAGAAQVVAPNAGLSIEVVPPEGIAIWLEGTRLSTRSPFTSTTLRPGAYTLLVRGMGYLPFTLPVELKAGEMVRLPVSLRPRLQVGDPLPTAEPQRRAQRPLSRSTAAASGAGVLPQGSDELAGTAAPAPPTAPLSTPLPDGVAPLLVRLVASPAAPLRVDGAAAQGEVRLRYGHGVLQAGSLRIEYDVTPSRVLEFVVPNDNGLWFKDGTQVKPTSVIRITLGSTRLQRTAGVGGSAQSIVIKRIL